MPPALDTLPPEILFNVLSYADPFCLSPLPNHPLFTVAATCRQLCSTVEEYSRSLLKQHANFTPPKKTKSGAFACRKRWIKWLTETCQLCGKKSVRRAILDPGMTCCMKCDRTKIPKTTMTDASSIHGLSKLDLFTPNILHPTLPPLDVGVYTLMGGTTCMISTSSVDARKAHIAGLLGAPAQDQAFLRRRVAKHNRIIEQAGIAHDFRDGYVQWVHSRGKLVDLAWAHLMGQSLRNEDVHQRLLKDWTQTKKAHDNKKERAKKSLREQWSQMGMQLEWEDLPEEVLKGW